jgi:hypothetical protein
LKITLLFSICLTVSCDASASSLDEIANSLWGTAPPNKAYLGMFTMHLRPEAIGDRWVNNLVGFQYHSLFVGTFTNSFNDQTYVAGIERDLHTHQFVSHPNVTYVVGYRLGLVYGYDGRLMKLAAKTPILPFPQLVSAISYKHFGWEITYTVAVVSTGFFIPFH